MAEQQKHLTIVKWVWTWNRHLRGHIYFGLCPKVQNHDSPDTQIKKFKHIKKKNAETSYNLQINSVSLNIFRQDKLKNMKDM